MKNRLLSQIGQYPKITRLLVPFMVLFIALPYGSIYIDIPRNDAPVDKSLLATGNCRLPCWNGLEPGKTTKAEVLAAIPNISFIPRNYILAPLDPSQPNGIEVILWTDSLRSS